MWSSKEVIRVIIEAGSGFAAVMFAVDKFMSAAHSDQRAKDGDCRIAHTGMHCGAPKIFWEASTSPGLY